MRKEETDLWDLLPTSEWKQLIKSVKGLVVYWLIVASKSKFSTCQSFTLLFSLFFFFFEASLVSPSSENKTMKMMISKWLHKAGQHEKGASLVQTSRVPTARLMCHTIKTVVSCRQREAFNELREFSEGRQRTVIQHMRPVPIEADLASWKVASHSSDQTGETGDLWGDSLHLLVKVLSFVDHLAV